MKIQKNILTMVMFLTFFCVQTKGQDISAAEMRPADNPEILAEEKILNNKAETLCVLREVKNESELKGKIFRNEVTEVLSIGPDLMMHHANQKLRYSADPNSSNKMSVKIGEHTYLMIMEKPTDQIDLSGGIIGVGSKLRFELNEWIIFLGKQYRKGGVNIIEQGFQFFEGTQRQDNEGMLTFDGGQWLKGGPDKKEPTTVPVKEKLNQVVGTIEHCDLEIRKLRIVKDTGGQENLTIAKDIVVLAGDRKVSTSVLKKGIKAVVSYAEQKGEPVPDMGVPIILVAKEVHVDTSIEDTTPISERFVDNRDGTVTDTKTKLMWQKEDNGKEVSFEEAQDYCKNLKLGGYVNWRLPRPEEKDTAVVVELMMPKHSTDKHADYYWSNDPTVLLTFNYPTSHMLLSNAYGANKDARAYVKVVRQITVADITRIPAEGATAVPVSDLRILFLQKETIEDPNAISAIRMAAEKAAVESGYRLSEDLQALVLRVSLQYPVPGASPLKQDATGKIIHTMQYALGLSIRKPDDTIICEKAFSGFVEVDFNFDVTKNALRMKTNWSEFGKAMNGHIVELFSDFKK